MVTQKSLHFKIDEDTLRLVDSICAEMPGMNRNRYLNKAVYRYAQLELCNKAARFDDDNYNNEDINNLWHDYFGYKFDVR